MHSLLFAQKTYKHTEDYYIKFFEVINMNYYMPMQYGMGIQQQYSPNPTPMPQYNIPQYSTINGKIVDGEDIVRATEVPINSYGVFPKADLSSVYIKTWNPDGTTKVITYVPTATETTKSNALDDIYKAIDEINKKIDSLKSSTASKRRREVDDDE